jgi:Domain of unknown function (DUF4263)
MLCDRLAHEVSLFGDFVCDLAVGDSQTGAVLLVEFEDAADDSMFTAKRGRSTTTWAPRLEQGFSRISDWLWRLEAEGPSEAMERIFGRRRPLFEVAVIAGRSRGLSDVDRGRLEWRTNNTSLGGKALICLTYDDLIRDLSLRLQTFPALAGKDDPI